MALLLISNVLKTKSAQKNLTHLYSLSHTECMRDDKLGPEVGSSRENDQKAVLKHYLPELNYKISNSLPQDFELNSEPISQKHVTGKPGTGSIKAKWTSDETMANSYIEGMLAGDPAKFTHLLLTYIEPIKKCITIYGIDREAIRTTVMEMKEKAFTHRVGTNTRGVEYSSPMVKKLLTIAAFKIEFEGDVTGGMDPIQRRLQLLSTMSE
jgi:hypothetical protein